MDDILSSLKELLPLFSEKITNLPENVPPPTSNTIIIYPPTIDWHWMKQRPQQLMEQFALHGYQVYYCNMTQKNDCLSTPLSKNLTLIHNNSYFVKESIPYLKGLGKKIVVWASWSKLYPLISHYDPDFVIYDYLDDIPAWESYLQGMVEMADVVVTTAKELQRQMDLNYPDKPDYFIPNGCAIDQFQTETKYSIPQEFQEHSGPIILYSGAWANWVDIELVEKIARTFPEVMVAIVGAEFNATINRTIPNICYVGHQSYENLPAYIKSSTVCIIPFLINSITVAANPIKVYEYLAADKPVISTALPEVFDMPGVQIASTHEQFISYLEQTLNGEIAFPNTEVHEWLKNQTWNYRFEHIQKMLLDFEIDK